MIVRREIAALAAAGVLAVAMPLLLLPAGAPPAQPPPEAPPAPLTAPARGPLAAAFERPLFAAPAATEAEALPADAPSLVGIAGRIDRDAVALVRTGDGASRTLRIGESIDGWTLQSLAIDAAFFVRGNERVRVPLPEGE